jgi:hypothetical protein
MKRCVALLAFSLTSRLGAQTPTSSIQGTVADSATGQSVRRASVWLNSQRHARGDSLGRFAFDSVPPGRYRLSVQCATSPVHIRASRAREEEIEVRIGQRLTPAIKIDASGCDQRPFLDATGEFRGFYEGGFEHSRFVPCPGPVAGLPPSLSEARDPETWVWVEFGPRAAPRPWPDGDDMRGFTRWYVHWRGMIRGPDRYGHLDVATYEAAVDTFLSMRRPGGTDCK